MVDGENPSRGSTAPLETKGAPLDVQSKRGQSSLEFERKAIEKFSLAHSDFRFIETPKDRPALVDGVMMRGGVLSAVVEVKVRNVSRRQMRVQFKDEWLVTADKIDGGRALGLMLSVPFVGMLYLIPDEVLMVLKITDDQGEWMFPFDRRKTITRKTINGGEAERVNAFLPLATAKEIQ